jgi:hypothetical protein
MRRVLATATLGLALLGMAACADQEVPAAGSSSGPAATSAAPAPAASPVDKETACATYAQAETAAKMEIVKLFGQVDAIKADPAKAQQAVADLTKALGEFETALTPIAAGATDPELKAAVVKEVEALKKVPAAVAAAGGDVEKTLAVFQAPEFSSIGTDVKALCGK